MKKTLLIAFLLISQICTFAQEIASKQAKAIITAKAKELGLTKDQLSNFLVSSAFSENEMSYFYLQQTHKGIPIRNQIKVVALKNGNIVNNAGDFLGNSNTLSGNVSSKPNISARNAVANAFEQAGVQVPAITAKKNNAKNNFRKLDGVYEDVTANLEWYPIENRGKIEKLLLVWAVVVAPNGTDDIWQYMIDANTGATVNKYNFTIHENEKSKNTNSIGVLENSKKSELPKIGIPALNATQSPEAVANASYFVSPWPAESPIHPGGAAATRSNPWSVAGNAGTLGWHSNGTTDYTITRGNNVWATEDNAGTNANVGQPATSSTGPDPLTFNFPANFSANPRSSQFQPFAITNLFYWNNIIHDITYLYGFTEVNGNFQVNNQGRGGAGGDDVQALAQSGAAGCVGNNANMATPPDGGRPRMRMYLWSAPPSAGPKVTLGATTFNAVESNFSTANSLACYTNTVNGQLVYFNDPTGGLHQACGAGTTPSNNIAGKIVLIDRGNCNFTEKVQNAQNAGAIAVIMVNNVPGAPIVMGGGPINTITIPAIMVSDVDGAALIAAAASSQTVSITPPISLDSDLDNGVIVHEYTHGISNRLTGGPATTSCLQNAEQAGEGWSDYFALMLCTNWATAQLTDGAIPRPIAAYVNGDPITGAGIRSFPYSTNAAVNPLTYANMGTGIYNGSAPHPIGEIWCNTIWDMTWAIIGQENAINPNLYNFTPTTNGGNSIAFKLVTEGMRLQPCSPGFINMRDAVLAADRNLYNGRHACTMWTIFAKHGLGFGASQGSSASVTDQTPSTVLPPAPTVTTQPVDATVALGNAASFTANAGTDVNLIYQWQVSTDGGNTWNNVVPAVITSTLNFASVTAGMNGNKYRALVYIGCAQTTTNVATLNITGLSTPPAITTQPANVTACSGTNATFTVTATGTGNTYNWQVSTDNGASWNNVTPVATSTTLTLTAVTTALNNNRYRVQISNPSGNITSNGNATLTVNTTPAAPTVTAAVTYCQGATASALTATGTGLLWYTAATGGTGSTTAPTPSTTAAGVTSYFVSQTVASCESPRAQITVTITATPAAPTASSPVNICQGAVANQLSATGTNLLWYTTATGGTGSATAPTPSTATTGLTNYYVSQTVAGCESPRTLIAVNVTSVPTAPTVTTPISICQGVVANQLTATGSNLLWYTTPTGGTGSTTAPTPNTATTGTTTYYVSQTTGCESPRAAIVVNIIPGTAAPTVTTPITYCQNATPAALTATGSNLLWYTTATGGTGSSTPPAVSTATPGATTYYVTQTVGTCESPRAPIVVNVNAAPAAPTVVTLVSYCQNATATALTATGSGLLWFTTATGGTGSATAPTPNTATIGSTTFYVSQTVAGCQSSRAAIVVNVNAIPAAPVTTNVVYCQNATATALTANGANLLWYTAASGGTGSATAPTPNTSTVANTNYYVSQTVNGCESPRALITVVVNTTPLAPTVTNANISYCQGSTATALTASGSNLLWYTVATGGVGSNTAPVPSTTTAGTANYYVSQTTGSCESPRTLIAVTTTAAPSITTQPQSITTCVTTATFNVVATGTALTYQWFVSTDGGTNYTAIPAATNSSYTITGLTAAQANNRYRVVVSSGSCTPATSNAVTAAVGTAPSVVLSASTNPAVFNPSSPGSLNVVVTPAGSYTYIWTLNGANINNNTTSLTPANGLFNNFGSYQVTATNTATGCSGTSNTIAVSDLPDGRNELYISPNPTQGIIRVTYYNDSNGPVVRNIAVYDSKGALVLNQVSNFNSARYGSVDLNLQRLASGNYLVVLLDKDGKKIKSKKVMKF
jgi:Fungalysin metallopeptidase (M36)/PA domain/Ig-like domain CHU_C associated/Secretion system C-terminal sorting domain/Fungalysin/Thermolysin Propeptide Motif